MPDSRDITPMSRCAPAGMGTYLLNIDDGKVEEKVYPGGSSRAGRLGPEVYVELFERFG